MSGRRGRLVLALHAGVLALLLGLQAVLPPFHHGMVARIMVLAAYAAGYNVLLGYTGLMSLGHAMLFASGMYATGLSIHHLGFGASSGFLLGVLASVPAPAWLKYVLYWLIVDALGYWQHRLQHQNPFLWAFHSVHHTQTQPTLLTTFRNHGAFHEDCTIAIADRLVGFLAPRWLRIGGYWFPRGGIPIDVFWQTGRPPAGLWIPEQGVTPYRGRG